MVQKILVEKVGVELLFQQYSRPLVSLKVANGRKGKHLGTILVRVRSVWFTCDYNAISVQFQPQLSTGTELDNKLLSLYCNHSHNWLW